MVRENSFPATYFPAVFVIELLVARPVFMTPAVCDLGCLVMPLLEDSALVHEPPPRLPGIRGPQIGRHRWVPKAPRLLSEALSFKRLTVGLKLG